MTSLHDVPSEPEWECRLTPAVSWWRVWTISLLLTLCVSGALEFFWRRCGWQPHVADSPALWAWHRGWASGPDSDRTIVFLGQSISNTGISREVLKQQLPDRRTIQLGVPGRPAKAALEDLANDDGFRGVVVYIFASIDMDIDRRWWTSQEDYVTAYRKGSFNIRLNAWLNGCMQGTSVVLHPALGWQATLIRWLRTHALPEYYPMSGLLDRSLQIDFRRANIAYERNRFVEARRLNYQQHVPSSPAAWLKCAAEFERLADRIAARGGCVAFVKFPVAGESLLMEEANYPRRQYWDAFAAASVHATVHFGDVPEFSRLDCPDTIHLDYRDAPVFTAALIDELKKLHVF